MKAALEYSTEFIDGHLLAKLGVEMTVEVIRV